MAVDVIKVLNPEVGRTPARDRESERLSTQLFLWQAPKGATLCQALCFFPTPNKDICHEWWADRILQKVKGILGEAENLGSSEKLQRPVWPESV